MTCRWLVLLLGLLVASAARAEDSVPAPLAAQFLLLDIARAGETLVAVGDHGHILLSVDQGHTWRQQPVPTRALLTGVSFPDARHGWAVGHDGVILVTDDGGESWTRQDAGDDLETAFLDVCFTSPRRGFAVGAYGKFLETEDGGGTWTATAPMADELHYNSITAGSDGWLYLAGESGTLLVSPDDGRSWHKSELPYAGSLFGVLPLEQGRVIAYGLRGHILRSEDHGATWGETGPPALPVLIMGGARPAPDLIVLAGYGGNFFLSHDGGRVFSPWHPAGFETSVAAILTVDEYTVVAVGEGGATRITLP